MLRKRWYAVFIVIIDLGVYGDVQRVKILYNKKDSALVQLAEPHQAQLGKQKIILHIKIVKALKY